MYNARRTLGEIGEEIPEAFLYSWIDVSEMNREQLEREVKVMRIMVSSSKQAIRELRANNES